MHQEKKAICNEKKRVSRAEVRARLKGKKDVRKKSQTKKEKKGKKH